MENNDSLNEFESVESIKSSELKIGDELIIKYRTKNQFSEECENTIILTVFDQEDGEIFLEDNYEDQWCVEADGIITGKNLFDCICFNEDSDDDSYFYSEIDGFDHQIMNIEIKKVNVDQFQEMDNEKLINEILKFQLQLKNTSADSERLSNRLNDQIHECSVRNNELRKENDELERQKNKLKSEIDKFNFKNMHNNVLVATLLFISFGLEIAPVAILNILNDPELFYFVLKLKTCASGSLIFLIACSLIKNKYNFNKIFFKKRQSIFQDQLDELGKSEIWDETSGIIEKIENSKPQPKNKNFFSFPKIKNLFSKINFPKLKKKKKVNYFGE